jgi:hypothetical protein
MDLSSDLVVVGDENIVRRMLLVWQEREFE